MRGHWKPGGGFPPPLFLLETGVSSLCPVPCSKILYQEEQKSRWELAVARTTGWVERTWRAGACLPQAPAPLPRT